MSYIDWMGKEDVQNHHKNITYKTIECKEEIGDKDSENMIIKGDNLLALKSLLPYYASSVKMIYIDPPYNTGNTSWVYNDNMDSPLIKKWLNDTVNSDDLSRSDKWLCMMYPRLKLLRELLKDDGVIFISIDDAEVFNLKLICDEIFGKENFIAQFIWKKRTGSNDAKSFVSIDHEYILCYSKSNFIRLAGIEKTFENYKNPDNDLRGDWIPDNLTCNKTYKERENLYYSITNPQNGITYPCNKKRVWAYEKSRMERLIKEDKIIFPKTENGTPMYKRHKSEVRSKYQPISSLLGEYLNANATKNLRNIFNGQLFDYPKNVNLLKLLVKQATSKDDIILDSFAGSGTTAHAVLAQNKEDGGNRKFILIETLDYAKDITAERVKRVIQGYDFTGKDKTTLYENKLTTTQILKPETMEKVSKEVATLIEDEKLNYDKIEKTFKENTLKVEGIKDIKSFKEGIGGGFKYCELSYDIFDEFGELNANLSFEQIAKHIYFVEFKKPIDKREIEAPFVGSFKDTHIYFYENKFLNKDLTQVLKRDKVYKNIIIYTTKTTVSDDILKEKNIIIRYIPYDIKDN